MMPIKSEYISVSIYFNIHIWQFQWVIYIQWTELDFTAHFIYYFIKCVIFCNHWRKVIKDAVHMLQVSFEQQK